MSKPELGVKRDCPECGARFYDLNKDPAHCPKCDNQFVPEALLKPRRPRIEEEQEGDGAPAKPAAETSLESADKERKAAESKRKPAMDDEEESDDEDIDGLGDIDIDIDDDDEDDDSLLDDDDDDDDVSSIVSGQDDDD